MLFRERHPPVVVMGLRRGGTTMVADTIAANRGIWHADEPYAVFPGRPGYETKIQLLPTAEHSHFFGLDGEDLQRFEHFSSQLLKAKFRSMGTARRTGPLNSANRVSLKVLNAPWMLPWFRDTAKAHIIIVLRHPAAQALSVLRQKWAFPIEAYLKRPDRLTTYLTEAEIEKAQNVLKNADPFQLAVLDWIVSSAPLRKEGGARVQLWRYEQIVENREAFVDQALVSGVGLREREMMVDLLSRPSGSRRMSLAETNAGIARGDVRLLTEGWRAKLSDQDRRAGQELLDAFSIDEYRFAE